MQMNNHHNRAIYRRWAPIYDAALGRFFAPGRRLAASMLDVRRGERVLLLGVGTGADLALLPAGARAVGVDLSPEMLARAQARLPLPGVEVELREGDAQDPPVDPASFDAVLLGLVLSVVPDGAACLRAAVRAARPGGRIVIFDKLLADAREPSVARRLLNRVTTRLGTDVTRRFADLAAGLPCRVLRDEPSLLGGAYRVMLLEVQ
jgi:ubiquinone/menaquinone biosynthesis C-methylase UbiE